MNIRSESSERSIIRRILTHTLPLLMLFTFLVQFVPIQVLAATSWFHMGWDSRDTKWSPGNLINYNEGDNVPFRAEAVDFDSTSPITFIELDHKYRLEDPMSSIGYDGIQPASWFIGPITPVDGGTAFPDLHTFADISTYCSANSLPLPIASGSLTFTASYVGEFTSGGAPIAGQTGPSMLRYAVEINPLIFDQLTTNWGGDFAIYYEAHLAQTGKPKLINPSETILVGAGGYPGSSLQARLSIGDKTVPLPTRQLSDQDIPVEKTWLPDNSVSVPVTINLMAKNGASGTPYLAKTIVLDGAIDTNTNPEYAPWKGMFIDVPLYYYVSKIAYPITYWVEEVLAGFMVASVGNAADGFVVTNTKMNPLLSIVKTGAWVDGEENDGFAQAGEVINYTFAVKNEGNVTLTNVMVTDPKITVAGGPTTLDVGETDSTTFTGSYILTQADIDAGKVDNTATADSDESGPASDSETVALPQNPLLSIVKTGVWLDADADGYADVGEVINYSFAVKNEGNVTLTNVMVTDPKVTVSGGPTTLDVSEMDNTTFSGQYTLTQDDIDAGKVDNTATADSDQSGPDSDDETVILPQNPLLSIVKTGTWVDANADGYADVGEVINYSFAVKNEGNVTLNNVTVTDPKVTVVGGPITLDVGETDSTTFTGSYILKQADIDSGKVDNTATADSDESGPASDSETVALPRNPLLSIVKTGAWVDANDDGFAQAGEIINYSFAVKNEGNVTLTNVMVTDPKITVLGGPTTLDVGETDTTTFTGSYSLTQADIDAGSFYNLATADSHESEPASDEETVVLPQNPLLSIVKTGAWVDANDDGFAQVGEVINYTFAVKNEGNVTLTNVIVTDPKIAVSGGPTTLDVGETDSTTFTGSYILTQADIDVGKVENTATADSNESGPASDSETVALPQNGALSIIKTGAWLDGDGDGFADVGEVINYFFTVTNEGNVTLTNVMVTDSKITVLGGPTTLDVGETDSTTFTGSYILTQADIDAGKVDNTATADSDESEPASDDETVFLPQNPLLSIVKSGAWVDANADGFAQAGEVINYTFAVKNEGNVTLTNVMVTDPMVTVLGGPTTLDVGETDSATFTGSYSLTQADIDAGSFYNKATADSNESGPASDDETVALPQNPLLSIVKTGTWVDGDGDGFAQVGEVINYSFAVKNEGNVTLTNVMVTDPKITVLGGPTTLDVGETDSTTFTGSYSLTQADIDAGYFYNEATADSEESGPASDEETVALPRHPMLSIVKTGSWVDANADGFAQAGEVINYSFAVKNEGNVTLTNVMVTDPKIAISGGPTTLDVGETDTTTFTGSYFLTQADIDAGSFYNIATADSDESEPASDEETVVLPQNGALSIIKTGSWLDGDGDGFAQAGEVINYTFAVKNEGNMTLTNVMVTDPMVTVLGGPTTLDVGETDSTTFTGSYSLTQADIDAGSFYNKATADSNESGPASDDETVALPQNPLLSIVKTGAWVDGDGDGYAQVGEVINYSFAVKNEGNVTLNNVMVIDPKITVSGGPTTLDVGETDTTTFTGSYSLTQADIDAGSFYNMAIADSDESGPASDEETVVLPQNPALSIDKTAIPSTYAAVGDVISYSYLVTNTGNVTLYGVFVVDDKAPTSPVSVDLAPQESATFTASYTISQADLDLGFVTNIAFATDGTTVSEPDSETVTAGQSLALTILKSAAPPTYGVVGEIISYSYLVTNTGNVTLYNISVVDDKATTSPASVPVLAPLDTAIFTASYTITQADLDIGSVTNTAYATDGAIKSEPDSETVTADKAPALMIVKTATPSTYSAVGEVISYSYEVTNTGNVTLHDVFVVDDKAATIPEFLPVLAPQESANFTASYTISQADLDAGFVTNSAYATDGTTESEPDEETVNAVKLPALTIDKTATPSTYAAVGDVISYSYLVTNTGNITLHNVYVVDDKATTSPASIDVLAPQESATFTASYTISQADLDLGFVTNIAFATDGTTVSEPDSETVTAGQSLALMIDKSAAPPTYATVGEIISYSYLVTNTGNVTLYNVSVVDNKAETSPASVPVLAPNATANFTASYLITQADLDIGSVTNTAYATDGAIKSEPDSETVTAVPFPALTIDKTATPSTYSTVGEVISYSYLVTNTGNVTLHNIYVVDNKATTSPELVADLAPNATATFTASYAITQADLDAGFVTNSAFATDGTTESPPDEETVKAVPAPALTIDKTAKPSTYAAVGDVISYSYLVTNTGNVTLHNVYVVDNKATTSPESVADLAPLGTATFEASYVITQADLDAGSVTNTAYATDGTTESEPDSETVIANQAPALTLIKSGTFNDEDGDGYASPGETISYTFSVSNTGNVTLHNVTLADTIGGVTISGGPLASLALGVTDDTTFTGSYAITQTDIDAGHFYNKATADSDESEPESDDEDVTLPSQPVQTGQLLPTQTTLDQYVVGLETGTFPYMYEYFTYGVKKTVINSVSPGVIFYFNRITAPASSFTMDIVQENTLSWRAMLVQKAQANLYDANLQPVQSGIADNSGNVHFDLTGLTSGGIYYVMIKYSPGNLVGQDVTADKLTSVYSWQTDINGTHQAGSKDSIPVQPK